MTTPPPPLLRVGAFELLRPVSTGGLATVWHAKHRRTGRDVAVKVVRQRGRGGAEFRRIFVTDAQSIARIAHPNVVQLYDTGDVSEETARASGGKVAAGSPYLVMEYAPNGAIDVGTKLPWPAWLHTMTQMLRGLAHVHSRGMLHLDLKPQNLLLWGADPETWHVKLTDFGTARRYQEVERAGVERWDLVQGTPIYMAPEQFESDWSRLAPETDIYGAGVVGFELAFGRVPFDYTELADLYRAHLMKPLVVPDIDAPDGLAGWMQQALAKEPSERFRSAAAALRALERVARPSAITLPTLDWRAAERERPMPMIQDELLRLLPLREPPLIGREAEQDQLWSHFQTVLRIGRPQVVILSGVAGAGKTRLASWLCERAAELGLARTARARHDRIPASHHGVVGLLDMLLGTGSKNREEVHADVHARLAEDARDASDRDTLRFRTRILAELMRPARTNTGSVLTVRDASPLEYEVACRRLIDACASEQPLILHLDDAHWDQTSLRVAESLQRHSDAPILILVTIRESDLDARPSARLALDRMASKGATLITLAHLERSATEQLISELTNLERGTLRRVVDRTDGNPLFAITLVQKLMESGALVREGGHFCLRDPDALRGVVLDVVWLERVERALRSAHERTGDAFGPSALQEALEIGCVLGSSIRLDEWNAAASALPEGVVDAVCDALSAANIAMRSEELLILRHPMIREAVDADAHLAGRATRRHEAAAAALADGFASPSDAPREVAVRIGRHLMESGADMKALEWLRAAVVEDFIRPLKSIREEVSPLMRALVERVGEDQLTPALRLTYLELQCISAQNASGTNIDVIEATKAWQRLAHAHREPGHICLSAELLSYEYLFRGRTSEAIDVATLAVQVARKHPEQPWFEVETLRALSEALVAAGRYADAQETVSRIFEILPTKESRAAVVGHYTLGRAAMYLGDVSAALSELDKGLTMAQARGWDSIVATLLVAVGGAHTRLGRLDDAEHAFVRASDYFRRTRNSRLSYSLVGLGECRLLRRDFREALSYAVEAHEQADVRGQHGLSACACLIKVASHAALGDWDGFDSSLHAYEQHRSELEETDLSLRTLFTLAIPHVPSTAQPERRARLGALMAM